ncbi:MAG: hypothetical protein ACRCY9_18280, partial [Phycicoccus sp.]
MSRVVIRDARYVVTVDERDTVLEHATVTVDDGVVTAVGEAPASGAAADTEIDARGTLLMPGLVNL